MKKDIFKKMSIRKQLLTWNAVVLIVNTLIFFFSFYLLTVKYFDYETERSLSLHASQIAYSISATNTNDVHDSQTIHITELSKRDMPGVYIEVVDVQGYNSEGALSVFKGLNAHVLNKGEAEYNKQMVGSSTMRIIAVPIRGSSNILGSVIMGHPIDVYENTLGQLRNIGIFVLLFLTIPSVLIGYYFTKLATNPISKLSMDINTITTENLAKRVDLQSGSEETADLIKNFNSLLDRLNTSFKLERQFLGELAHEVKTPLAVIKNNSEVTLSKQRTIEEYQGSIKQTLIQIDKLSSRLISLMDFAWSQSTDLDKTFSKVNLSLLLNELCNVATYMATRKNVQVTCDIKDNIYVFGKEEKLYQAIYNLIDNGIKYNKDNGELNIELSKKGKQVIMQVIDTGVGIDAEEKKTIFNRFYRSEQNKNIAGYGLGLAIAASIIKAHKGNIKVESDKGAGSTFVVTLNALS